MKHKSKHQAKKQKQLKQIEMNLRYLYNTENLTTREIAKKYDVSKTTILRWFNRLNIKSKDAYESRHYTGFTKPSKEALYMQTLIEGKTYQELGVFYNVDPSTIANWLRSYNIPRPTNAQKRIGLDFVEPTKAELYYLYIQQELSARKIAKELGISPQSVRRRLRKYDIPLRPSGFRAKRFETEDGDMVRSLYEQRIDNWLYQHHLEHEYEPSLPFPNHCMADFKVGNYYIEIWGVSGPKYKKRKQQKQLLYKKHKLKLIEINPQDFYRQNISKKLGILLSKNNSEQLTLSGFD